MHYLHNNVLVIDQSEYIEDRPVPGPFPAFPMTKREKPWERGCSLATFSATEEPKESNGLNDSSIDSSKLSLSTSRSLPPNRLNYPVGIVIACPPNENLLEFSEHDGMNSSEAGVCAPSSGAGVSAPSGAANTDSCESGMA